MGYIPKNSKVKIKVYKSLSIMDIVVISIALIIIALVVSGDSSGKWGISIFLAVIFFLLMIPYGEERVYEKVLLFLKYLLKPHRYGYVKISNEKYMIGLLGKEFDEEYRDISVKKGIRNKVLKRKELDEQYLDISVKKGIRNKGLMDIELLVPYEKIEDVIINKDGSFISVIEVEPINLFLMGEYSQRGYVEAFQRVINSIGQSANMCIFKESRLTDFCRQLLAEDTRLERLEAAFQRRECSEIEYIKRKELIEERKNLILSLRDSLKVKEDKIYIAFIAGDRDFVIKLAKEGILRFDEIKMIAKMIVGETLLELVKDLEVEEVNFTARTMESGSKQRSFMYITGFPDAVENGWLSRLFSIENTKVMLRINPLDKEKAKKRIDTSILEAEGMSLKGKSSAEIKGVIHAESLKELLYEIADGREKAYEIEIILSVEDKLGEKRNRKEARRKILEAGFSCSEMTFLIDEAYSSSLIRRADCIFSGNTLTSNLIAESFPFISDKFIDEKGVLVGENNSPVFLDLFKRDKDRVNSNMVIIGRTGSGKSYAAKNILSSLSTDLVKVFVLDPEGEYSRLVKNMGGVVLNVSSDAFSRINPFEIINSLPDELDKNDCDYFNHLQFLEEFIKTALPGVSQEIIERINRLIMEMYRAKGFDEKTTLKSLTHEDYPTFDDLSNHIVEKIKGATEPLEKGRLIDAYNALSRFREGGSLSSLWNGKTTIDPRGNLVSYNFQGLLAGKNTAATNAEMLLLLKTMENEIMKNRENNIKNHLNNKLCVVIDEAHVFIDPKYPASLDFMYSLAKRIRKYDGMLLIITQNIKDFSGSTETSRKTSAIINASQYSLIFSLNPGDISDLCELYSKAGEITEMEREGIVKSPRGRALLIASPDNHTFLDIVAPKKAESYYQE